MTRPTDDALHATNYAVDEAQAFLDRHPDARAHAYGGSAALVFGLLRACYESPCHPGTSLCPLTDAAKATYALVGDWWVCPDCGQAYRYRDATEARDGV